MLVVPLSCRTVYLPLEDGLICQHLFTIKCFSNVVTETQTAKSRVQIEAHYSLRVRTTIYILLLRCIDAKNNNNKEEEEEEKKKKKRNTCTYVRT
jgi:hypothetical protein